jgi:hypothetical protein
MPHGCVPAVRPRACIPPAPTPAPPEPTPFPPYSAPQPTPSSLPLILAQAYNTAPRPLTPAQPSPNLLAYRPWPRPTVLCFAFTPGLGDYSSDLLWHAMMMLWTHSVYSAYKFYGDKNIPHLSTFPSVLSDLATSKAVVRAVGMKKLSIILGTIAQVTLVLGYWQFISALVLVLSGLGRGVAHFWSMEIDFRWKLQVNIPHPPPPQPSQHVSGLGGRCRCGLMLTCRSHWRRLVSSGLCTKACECIVTGVATQPALGVWVGG